MDDWSMPMPDWQDHAASDVGNLDSASSTKKLAKLNDVCGKVATEEGGSRFPTLANMVPCVPKSARTAQPKMAWASFPADFRSQRKIPCRMPTVA